ncbi:S-adenosyl-L-methionine-dependent methyltransferase [Zychaea mexicana]|uniref:S-adenosyl-L-methionine-dependent methyltransferase n=1 Tax=Zychaea mexicana TaxID=64656 RepID=UPI0022FDF53A|nr:S-adenosyl-L-methionine-dependent methyltransferase [Zychaea mexicana]KAI9489076.1 S-adenosyl-L-methionine-dependent methyltransferase [Zychaea mexicana]
MSDPIRCLEFFSGIGGLHYALNIAEVPATVVCAFDVNMIANQVYEYNFGHAPSNKTIERLTAKDIEKFKADCWLLSPPCQPYTQGGNMKDIDDPRAQGLVHLINLLPKLADPPTFLFLENVKNFEESQSRAKLVETLQSMNYQIKECLLSPIQFGIPNHRARYYMMARRLGSVEKAPSPPLGEIHTKWPFAGEYQFEVPELSQFIENSANDDLLYRVPEKEILKRHKFRFDIVQPSDNRTSCVTKAYGSHHLQTSGSLVQTQHLERVEYDWSDPKSLLELGLRFLTPIEISRLHAFPMPEYQLQTNTCSTKPRPFNPPHCLPHLMFPDSVSLMQRYRLLGNSLNCWVVAELLRCELF